MDCPGGVSDSFEFREEFMLGGGFDVISALRVQCEYSLKPYARRMREGQLSLTDAMGVLDQATCSVG